MNKRIKQVFEEHDIDDMGELNGDYLLKALRALHLPVHASDIPDLFESVSREKQRRVTYDDFVEIVTELKVSDCIEESLASKAFDMLVDPAADSITLNSLMKACQEQDETWTTQQVIEMMNEADLNHDGLIDAKEFELICKKAGLF